MISHFSMQQNPLSRIAQAGRGESLGFAGAWSGGVHSAHARNFLRASTTNQHIKTMKFIIQLFLMLILALCGTSLYANDGAAPPGSPAGAPAEPVIQPTKPTSPSAPTDSKELPAKATRRKKEVEDADYKAEAPDEPDAWEPLTRGTQVLQIPRVGCIVRCAGHGMILVPFTKVETDDAGGRRLVNTH